MSDNVLGRIERDVSDVEAVEGGLLSDLEWELLGRPCRVTVTIRPAESDIRKVMQWG